VLARGNRITRGAEYKAVVRGGSRCAGPHTVTYMVTTSEDRAPRFGFIVSKQVGTAVTRNTVRRRLKAVCAEDASPLPTAASADFQDLRAEVIRCLTRRAAA